MAGSEDLIDEKALEKAFARGLLLVADSEWESKVKFCPI